LMLLLIAAVALASAYQVLGGEGILKEKSIVVCGKELKIAPNNKLPSVVKALRVQSGCRPKVIHVYKLNVIIPNRTEIQEALPYTTSAPAARPGGSWTSTT